MFSSHDPCFSHARWFWPRPVLASVFSSVRWVVAGLPCRMVVRITFVSASHAHGVYLT